MDAVRLDTQRPLLGDNMSNVHSSGVWSKLKVQEIRLSLLVSHDDYPEPIIWAPRPYMKTFDGWKTIVVGKQKRSRILKNI